ncbi:MAG: TldD/PmbA family protein [Bacillota bacterium]
MRDLTKLALETAKAQGAAYADIRVIRDKGERIGVKNGTVEALSSDESVGFGVRVLADGAWGFASSSQVTAGEMARIAADAVRIARASALVNDARVELAPVESIEARFRSKVKVDPFQVRLEDKISLLLEADRLVRQTEGIRISSSSMKFWQEDQVFASTEGSYIEQRIVESGGGIEAVAVGPGEMQRRSYPNSFGGDHASRGYEYVEAMNLPDHAEEVAREAVGLLQAKQCPAKETTIIIEGSQLGLQVHESCGHPIELDRVFGMEAAYAGTSFLTPEKQGVLQYGSKEVNITADATIEGGLGSFGYDDEGVPGQRVPIIQEGRFVNYLTSRETAPLIGEERSNGTMRADGWNRLPIIRMTNINLEPGDWTLEEMIKDTKEGLYLVTNKSWSIDDKRLNFQFGTEIGWEIVDGSLGEMVKNPTYTGITPEFWNSCDAVANRDYWHLWGLPNCGKGEPGQVAHVGHGAAPSRFRNVKVGVGQW